MRELQHRVMDDQAVQIIAAQVVECLRDELQALLTDAGRADTAATMTVGEVARQLGVARSTVYAHWREWGGFKLGRGPKAPIRFDASRLASQLSAGNTDAGDEAPKHRKRRRSRRRALIADAPRMPQPFEKAA